MTLKEPRISHGSGSYLYDDEGHAFLDLTCGFGTVFLGHADAAINAALANQANRVLNTGRRPSGINDQLNKAMSDWLNPDFKFGGLYSTGMEAMEFALRVAADHNGRDEFVGFEGSMHGKSIGTANLGWSNTLIKWQQVTRLPFPSSQTSPVDQLEIVLAKKNISAVVIEPIQGSKRGDVMPPQTLGAIIDTCSRHGTVSIVDETLTGFYRTGPRFVSDSISERPDIVVFAKSLGNGFPVSSIALKPGIDPGPLTIPGSTFSDSPLAAATVLATLREVKARVGSDLITRIESTVREHFQVDHATLQGQGALWIVEMRTTEQAVAVQEALARAHVLVSRFGACLRLLPQAEIPIGDLADAIRCLSQNANQNGS
ncbi:MAG: aminotransferase class III-fold pyridoxal phosphate-dependent enzyme [Pseudomonadota bacterium]